MNVFQLHFKSLTATLVLCLCAATASAADYTGSAPTSGRSYYIYNVAAGQFLSEGNNWGTHASLDAVGTDVKLTTSDDGFSVRTHFGSFYMNSASDGVWMDQSTTCKWIFQLVDGTNYYTISTDSTSGFLQYDGSSNKLKVGTMPATAENAYWQLVLQSELESNLANASYDSPIDATFYVPNYRFDVLYNETSAWEGTSISTIGGYRNNTTGILGGNWVAQWSDKTFDSYLTVTAKNGIYGIKAQGINSNDDDENSLDALFYANEEYTPLPDAHTGTTVPTTLNAAARLIASGDFGTDEIKVIAVNGKLTIGVKKETLHTNDWSVLDNIRLTYYGSSVNDYQTFVMEQLATNRTLATERLSAEALDGLNTTYASYDSTASYGKAKYGVLSKKLAAALADARLSIKIFGKLKAQISTTTDFAATATGEGIDELQAAITAAQAIYDNASSTDAEAAEATRSLQTAIMTYRFANTTGTVPTVTTDSRFARGCTMAFGRMTVTGVSSSKIQEQGFCYSTNPNPTYADLRTTEYFNNNGRIYVLSNLSAGTIYYMRAYALTTDYAIGYGDVIKVVTLPQANVKFTMRDGGTEEVYNRIKNAAQVACDIWNKVTSITGYNSSIGYASGTPTADCSYGGWMRVGPSTSYQATGTILHEWLHGIGVGTHSLWYGPSVLRANSSSGLWLGERANEVLRFWDNNESETLTGDGTHMWPYGINGAQEDTGTSVLYYGTSLIAQALGEDGLPPTGGFASPAYVFDQEDTIKYRIKSESADCGLYNSYLFDDGAGNLVWKQATGEAVNDSCAWYVKFTPSNSYYQIQNVATGRYITYNSSTGFSTAERTSITSAENLHLMKGRVDVTTVDGASVRGYWLIHPESQLTPPTLTANTDGTTTSTSFDISNDAVKQRWIISTFEEDASINKELTTLALDELEEAIKNNQALYDTPHTENENGVDDAFTTALETVNAQKASVTTAADVLSLISSVNDAGLTFLAGATPTEAWNPFDLTFMIENAGMDSSDGWTKTVDPSISYSCAEYYQTTFNIYQTFSNMPKGTYKFAVEGFQRPGSTADVYSAYTAGTSTITTKIYMGSKSSDIHNIMDGASDTQLGGTESSVGSQYVPNNMHAASIYFAAGRYENELLNTLTASSNTFNLGIRCTSSDSYYWSIFDDFRLYFYGSMSQEDISTAIQTVATDDATAGMRTGIYSMDGRLIRRDSNSLEGLSHGIYIVNGKKVVR